MDETCHPVILLGALFQRHTYIYIYTHIFAVYLHLYVYFRSTPHPVTVTTRIITYLVGNPYKPSFATVTGWGVDPMYIYIYTQNTCFCHVLLK